MHVLCVCVVCIVCVCLTCVCACVLDAYPHIYNTITYLFSLRSHFKAVIAELQVKVIILLHFSCTVNMCVLY